MLDSLIRWITRQPDVQPVDHAHKHDVTDQRLAEIERRQRENDARLRLLDAQADIRGYRRER